MSDLKLELDKLDVGNPENCPKLFRIVTEIQEMKGLSDYDVAVLFGTSVPSIKRWREGTTYPVPLIRRHIQKVLKELMSE